MKSSAKNRLKNLESIVKVNQRSTCALIICDADILHTFDFSFVEADHVLILPDNGRRLPGDEAIPKGSYVIRYL
jgi:hypothetical protein